jgi:hypothetical protein
MLQINDVATEGASQRLHNSDVRSHTLSSLSVISFEHVQRPIEVSRPCPIYVEANRVSVT